MKRIRIFVIGIMCLATMLLFNNNYVSAKEVVASKSLNNIFGETLGSVQVYDNGEIVIAYKYGLRQVDLYYCEKGNECDSNFYSIKRIMESNYSDTYKNDSNKLATYTYKLDLDKSKEYGIKVEAYFGTGKGYTGTESLSGSPTISSVQIADTGDKYINGTANSDIGDKDLNKMMDKLVNIVNTAVLPILYIALGLLLVIKGAILGVQIVKNADHPEIRMEKVHSLKWLVIGVGIAYAASALVGVLTGYFEGVFK